MTIFGGKRTANQRRVAARARERAAEARERARDAERQRLAYAKRRRPQGN